jgi:hypothetical protein
VQVEVCREGSVHAVDYGDGGPLETGNAVHLVESVATRLQDWGLPSLLPTVQRGTFSGRTAVICGLAETHIEHPYGPRVAIACSVRSYQPGIRGALEVLHQRGIGGRHTGAP